MLIDGLGGPQPLPQPLASHLSIDPGWTSLAASGYEVSSADALDLAYYASP